MSSPQLLAPRKIGSEWVGGTVVDTAVIQDGAARDRSLALAIR